MAIKVEGAFAVPIEIIPATATLKPSTMGVLLNNGATAITVTMPPLIDVTDGQSIVFTRLPTSTGAVTVNANTGATVQNRNGTTGATTTIATHSATGTGCSISFTKYGTVWYRM